MKRMLAISALMISTVFSANAMAGDRDAVVGAMVGGGAGALIGHSVNGRDGALIGSALGAITGVVIATSDRDRDERRTVVYEQRPVVRERVVVYQPRTVVVHRHEPRRVVVVDHRHGHGNKGRGNDWKRDYAYEGNDRSYGRGDGRGRWH